MTLVSIRGVTPADGIAAGPSPVAYYLDAVPFGLVKTAVGPDASAYDLDRVEVLRGPQGTLYGASTLNGVVRVLTEEASLEALEFKARTSASSTRGGTESYRGDLAVNVPIVEDKVAVRAAAGYQDLGGWIDKPNEADANDGEIGTFRLKVKAQPTQNLSIGLSAWLSRSDFGAMPASPDGERHPSLVDEPTSTDYDVYGVKIGYDFPGVSITSATGYLSYSNDGYIDFAVLGLPDTRLQTTLESKIFSQEINLSSSGDTSWRWSAGGMFREGEDQTRQFRRQYLERAWWSEGSRSFAVYGELTRLFMDGRLELTGGMRYFEDDVTLREHGRSNGIPTGQQPISTDNTYDALTPRVVLIGHPSERTTVYASYSEGFRSGFDQTPVVRAAAPSLPSAKPDTLENYELGTKMDVWGRRLTLDAAIYYMSWQDIQLPLSVPVPGAALFVNGIVNSESASGIGVDFAARMRPIEGLNLGVSFGWNDLALNADVFSAGVPLMPKGSRPSNSVEYTGAAFADYTFALGTNGFEALLSASFDYTGPAYGWQAVDTGSIEVPVAEELLTGRTSIAVISPTNWVLTLFVDNVTDERKAASMFPGVDGLFDMRIRPRTVGLQFEYHFAQ